MIWTTYFTFSEIFKNKLENETGNTWPRKICGDTRSRFFSFSKIHFPSFNKLKSTQPAKISQGLIFIIYFTFFCTMKYNTKHATVAVWAIYFTFYKIVENISKNTQYHIILHGPMKFCTAVYILRSVFQNLLSNILEIGKYRLKNKRFIIR